MRIKDYTRNSDGRCSLQSNTAAFYSGMHSLTHSPALQASCVNLMALGRDCTTWKKTFLLPHSWTRRHTWRCTENKTGLSLGKQTFHMFLLHFLLSVLLDLNVLHAQRIMGFFILITHKSMRLENPIAWLQSCIGNISCLWTAYGPLFVAVIM